MQVRCNACHRHDQETPGMDLIDLGKKTLEEYRCIACHVISGEGGLVGPELTYQGDKNPEFLDFAHVEGPQTALNWHFNHFQDPQAVVEGSPMPNLGFGEKEAKALALLMVSWRRASFPPEYIPPSHKPTLAGVPPIVREVPAPPREKVETRGEEAGRRLFQTRGCHTCHTVGKGKLIGPDLQKITLRRSDEWLSRWLADPAAVLRATPDLQTWPDEFGGILMPNQNLSTADIQALITYLRTF
jgi:cytochrome c2